MSDYPSAVVLEKIRTWPIETNAPVELFDFIRSEWITPYGHIREQFSRPKRGERNFVDSKLYALITGGWSGNEEILHALAENILWSLMWVSSHRGGLHVIEVGRIPNEKIKVAQG